MVIFFAKTGLATSRAKRQMFLAREGCCKRQKFLPPVPLDQLLPTREEMDIIRSLKLGASARKTSSSQVHPFTSRDHQDEDEDEDVVGGLPSSSPCALRLRDHGFGCGAPGWKEDHRSRGDRKKGTGGSLERGGLTAHEGLCATTIYEAYRNQRRKSAYERHCAQRAKAQREREKDGYAACASDLWAYLMNYTISAPTLFDASIKCLLFVLVVIIIMIR